MSVPCRSCGAAVVWLVNVQTGRPAPIDEQPDPVGNLVRVGEGEYEHAGPANLLDDRPRYVSHFATCPAADEWRGKRRARVR
jgi:hypothetical protein